MNPYLFFFCFLTSTLGFFYMTCLKLTGGDGLGANLLVADATITRRRHAILYT